MTEEIVISCLRHVSGDSAAPMVKQKDKYDPVTKVVVGLGAAWLLVFLIVAGLSGAYNYYAIFKAVPLFFLSMLATTRGITHIMFDSHEIHLQYRAANNVLKERKIPWRIVKAIVYVPPKPGKPLSTAKVVFRLQGRRDLRLNLNRVGDARQWDLLVTAISRWSPVPAQGLDPQLFQKALSVRDPSFTSLWLDAMACPPQRQRLEPLAAGANLQAGEYQILQALGAGGQGRAYLANSKSLGKVVLKEIIFPVYVEPKVRKLALHSFESEASTLKQINNAHIVGLYSSFFEDHRGYLVMQYIDGPSLRTYVKDHGPLSEQEVIRYAEHMCDILSCLHGLVPPLVHQDFTPDNLLLASDGRLRLIDFTIAQSADGETGHGNVAGKINYMPPEQFRGTPMPASDIYALGCTLHYLLTGEDPEPITTSFPLLLRRDISSHLSDIVAKCTALAPADRFANATDLKAALAGAVSPTPR